MKMANFQLNFFSPKEVTEPSSRYLQQWGSTDESNEDWKEEYKNLKDLKKYEVNLLEKGPKSQSQAWLVNRMWSDWKELKKNQIKQSSSSNLSRSSKEWEKAFIEWKKVNKTQN